jgi:glycosyltransferase involved in cell wall biosynthesis
MRIAILGTRGIPARYGGFETFAEQLAERLVNRGHQVTVYCRRPFTQPGDDKVVDARIRRIIFPTISSKYFDTLFHTFLSILHVLFTDAELVLVCNVANSPLAWIPRLVGKPTILNVDGLDRKRKKWNWFGHLVLFLCEMVAVVTPTRLVTDARVIQTYYWRRYRKRSTMIAYGAEVPPSDLGGPVFSLPPKRYILCVSRLEPENNPELVLEAYKKLETDWPLVVTGGNPYDGFYMARLKSMADGRVVFTGPAYGETYWALQKNAGFYVSASEVGGTHPGLVEAMAAQNPILYLDTPENRETVGDCGIAFQLDADDLVARMRELVGQSELRLELGRRARERAIRDYGWEEVTQEYEALFRQVLDRKDPQRPFSTA